MQPKIDVSSSNLTKMSTIEQSSPHLYARDDSLTQPRLREIIRRLWRRKMTLLVTLGVGLAFAVTYLQSRTVYYSAQGLLLIHDSPAIPKGIDDETSRRVDENAVIINETQRILSSDFLLRVINQLGDPKFLEPNVQEQSTLDGLSEQLSSIQDNISAWISDFFERESGTERASAKDETAEFEATTEGSDDPGSHQIQHLRRLVRLGNLEPSQIIETTATAERPLVASLIVNAILDVYIETRLEDELKRTQGTILNLTDRISALQEEIITAENVLEKYRSEANLLEGTSGVLISAQITDLNQKLIETRIQRAEVDATVDQVRRVSSIDAIQSIGAIDGLVDISQLKALETQLVLLKNEIAQRSAQIGDNHPTMKSLKVQQAEISSRIGDEIDRIMNRLEVRLRVLERTEAALNDRLETLKTDVSETNTAATKLRASERQIEAKRALVSTLLSRLAELEARRDLGSVSAGAEILSRARVPTKPSSPSPTVVVAMFTIVSLMTGVTFVYLSEGFRKGFVSTEAFERETGLRLIGAIPLLKRSLKANQSPQDVVLSAPLSAYNQSLRAILSNASLGLGSWNSVLVTSSRPGEGKSTVVSCLARAAKLAGIERVLVIDADFVNGTLHKIYNVNQSPGLLEVAQGAIAFWEALQKDPLTSVDVISAGSVASKSAPPLLIEKIAPLLHAARRHYDLILIDSPPFHVLPIVGELARIVDGVLLVVQWAETERELVKITVKRLHEANSELIGGILSCVREKEQRKHGYGDPNYYSRDFQKYYQD